MTAQPLSGLKHPALNRWRLFGLIALPLTVAMVWAMTRVDLQTAAGVSAMISFSVRCSVPFIALVVATSSLQVLFPGHIPAWLLRNRKYVGLCFAVAMAWQGLFIFIMSMFFRDYYYDEVFYLRDELEGSTGYIFLAAMVVTSFQAGRRWLSQGQWRLLHTSGLYFLWAYPFSVYWWNLFYYQNPDPIDYVFYPMCFIAFALRIAAWGKKRQRAAVRAGNDAPAPMMLRMLGTVVIGIGLVAAATGLKWQEVTSGFLLSPAWSAKLELWLPFWPFEPFLPLLIIGLGTLLFTQTDTTPATVSPSPSH